MMKNNYKITSSKQKFDFEFTTNLQRCFFTDSLLDFEADLSGLLHNLPSFFWYRLSFVQITTETQIVDTGMKVFKKSINMNW